MKKIQKIYTWKSLVFRIKKLLGGNGGYSDPPGCDWNFEYPIDEGLLLGT